MPIHKVEQKFSVERCIKPLLKAAGFKIRWIVGDYSRGEWAVNKHTALYIQPIRPGRLGLRIIGPDALAIAKVIEAEFPKLDLQVTETERPKPGPIARFFRAITQRGEFA